MRDSRPRFQLARSPGDAASRVAAHPRSRKSARCERTGAGRRESRHIFRSRLRTRSFARTIAAQTRGRHGRRASRIDAKSPTGNRIFRGACGPRRILARRSRCTTYFRCRCTRAFARVSRSQAIWWTAAGASWFFRKGRCTRDGRIGPVSRRHRSARDSFARACGAGASRMEYSN